MLLPESNMHIFLLIMQPLVTQRRHDVCIKAWPFWRPPACLWPCAWSFFKPHILPGFVSSTWLAQGHGIGFIASHPFGGAWAAGLANTFHKSSLTALCSWFHGCKNEPLLPCCLPKILCLLALFQAPPASFLALSQVCHLCLLALFQAPPAALPAVSQASHSCLLALLHMLFLSFHPILAPLWLAGLWSFCIHHLICGLNFLLSSFLLQSKGCHPVASWQCLAFFQATPGSIIFLEGSIMLSPIFCSFLTVWIGFPTVRAPRERWLCLSCYSWSCSLFICCSWLLHGFLSGLPLKLLFLKNGCRDTLCTAVGN